MRWANVTPSGLVWSKKLRAAMSSLWAWAAAINRGSSCTGPHGVAAWARASFTNASTCSAGVGGGAGAVVAGAAGGAVVVVAAAVSGGAAGGGVPVLGLGARSAGGMSAMPVGGGVLRSEPLAASLRPESSPAPVVVAACCRSSPAVSTWSAEDWPSTRPVATATPRGAAHTSTSARRSRPGDGRRFPGTERRLPI
jgi:hypothetical protein